MPKASKKTKEQLYALVSDEIMKARVAIRSRAKEFGLTESNWDFIDSILSDLHRECPQKVIDYFKD